MVWGYLQVLGADIASAYVVPSVDGIEAQDMRTGPEEGGAVMPPQRCIVPGCGRRLEFAAVEGVASSVGLRGVMRRWVCQDHSPVGACSRCGILAGPQYMVKALVNGRCPDCAGKPVRTAGVIGLAAAHPRLTKPRIHPRESLPV
jgi:hypothetical protein